VITCVHIDYESSIVVVFFQDLGRLIIWVLREYKEIEPIILSGEYCASP